MDIKEAAALLLQSQRNLSELQRRRDETIRELERQVAEAQSTERSLAGRIEAVAFSAGDPNNTERIVVIGGEAWLLRREVHRIAWISVPLGLVVTDTE